MTLKKTIPYLLRTWVSVLAAAGVLPYAQAQAPSQSQVQTQASTQSPSADLSSLYEKALVVEPNLQAAKAATDARRERLPQATSQLLPNLSFTSSRNKNHLITTAPDLNGNLVSTPEVYLNGDMQLRLTQPIFRPALLRDYQQAVFQVQDAEALLTSEFQNLSVKLSGAYFEALFAEDHLRLVQSQKSFLTFQLESAKGAFQAGSGTRTDIDEARARLDLVLAQELEAKQNMAFTRQELKQLVQEPVGAIRPLDPQQLPFGKAMEPLEYWQDLALQENATIRALTARVEAAKLEISKAEAGHLPTLDGVAYLDKSKSQNMTAISSSYSSKAIGLQLTVPLFAGGAVLSQVRQATAALTQAEQTLEAQRMDISSKVYHEYRGITEGALKVHALELAVKSSAQLVESAFKSYKAGFRTQVDVLNSEQQNVKNQEDLAQARYMYVMSWIRLWSLVNQADDVRMSQVNSWLTSP